MNALRILYLEDIPDHVELVSLAMQPQFSGTQVESAAIMQDAITCLQSRRYDVILASALVHGEHTIPRLHELLAYAGSTPIIIISGDGDEKVAANAIKHGASDYLIKSRESLEVLPYLIHRILKKKRHVTPDRRRSPQAPHSSENMNHLMTEIEHVSQRIHNIQTSANSDAATSSLRDDLRLLRQYAESLVDSRNTRKSKG